MADTTVLRDVYSNDTPLYWVFGILLTGSALPALILVPQGWPTTGFLLSRPRLSLS